jgi:hypothetical protein
MLGITNSFQGQEDTTATTGVAKQIQVQQASGRMRSKEFNKQTAFKELFEIMFEFKLAFYDELRPFLAKDANGNDLFGDFDKYKFLMKDAAGEFYYNTDFLFSADAGAGLPKDAVFQFNQAKEMLGSGAVDKLQYWTILEALNFPMAKEIKAQTEEQMQAQQQMEQMQQQQSQDQVMQQQMMDEQAAQEEAAQAEQEQMMAQQQEQEKQAHIFDQLLAQLPKHEQERFKKMPPEQQDKVMAQMMAEIGG